MVKGKQTEKMDFVVGCLATIENVGVTAPLKKAKREPLSILIKPECFEAKPECNEIPFQASIK